MDAAIRVIRYIKGTPGLRLLMPTNGNMKLTTYCDSNWGFFVEVIKYVTAYDIKLGETIISWKSKKQQTVSRSSAESEFRSMTIIMTKIIWLTGLFKELRFDIEKPVTLFCDSKVVMQITTHLIFHERSKILILIVIFFIEKIQDKLTTTQHIDKREQMTNLLTKTVCKPQYHYSVNKLGMKNRFSSISLRRSVE